MSEEEGYDPKCFHTCPDCDYRCNCGDIPCSHCLLFIATEEDGSKWVKFEDYEKLMKYKKKWETLIVKLAHIEMSGKHYGITLILHLMQDIKKEIKK